MDIFDEIPRGQLPIIILSTIYECDKYGYEIINDIKQKSDGKLIIKQPSLYSSLRRMEEQGLISSYWRDSEIGGKRHYYSITDFGKKYADKWQTDFISTQNSYNKLFNKNEPTPKQNNEPAQTDTFVQYDLFSNQTFISKPSVEVFESIKQEDNSNYSNFSLDSVQVQNKDNIITEYNSDKINKNLNDIETTNLKQEIKQLKNNNNSFTNSYINSQFEASVENDNTDNDIMFSTNNQTQIQELEPIIQSTNFDYEQSSSINLDNILNKKQSQEPTKETSDAVFLAESDRYEDVKINNEKNEQPKDDAVYITEKPDPDSLPKVKKIAPSRFELHNYDKLPKKLAEDKIETLYSQAQNEDMNYEPLFSENQPYINNEEDEINDETKTINFDQLKKYYEKNDINFLVYKKNSISNKKELSLFNHNKMKLISSIIFLVLTMIESISLYFAFKECQTNFRVFFYLPSILCLAYMTCCLIVYNKNKNKISNKIFFSFKHFMILMFISLLCFMVIWSINLLCGMTFTNTNEFMVTFSYPSILLLNLPIFYIVELIVSKLNIAKC